MAEIKVQITPAYLADELGPILNPRQLQDLIYDLAAYLPTEGVEDVGKSLLRIALEREEIDG